MVDPRSSYCGKPYHRLCLQYMYEGREAEDVHATGILQDGIDVQGTAVFK